MIIRDPFGKVHSVQDKYDNQDIVISTDHEFDEMTPTDQLSRSAYNWNRASTRINESRDVTLINLKPLNRKVFPGTRMGTRVKNW